MRINRAAPAALWAVILLSFFSSFAIAVEPWADKRLSVTNGLELWLDASTEIAARSHRPPGASGALISSKPTNGRPLDNWHDGSGRRRDLCQPIPTARPRFVRTAAGALVRFDGADDFLFASGIHESFEETTVFIVAAPHSNKGTFGAFLAISPDGENDYSGGLNIDMANGAKERFDFVNVEGKGFTGIQNLMGGTLTFGETHVLSIVAESGTNVTRLWVDGAPQQKSNNARPRKPAPDRRAGSQGPAGFGFDQAVIGARFFSNTAEPAHVQGFLDGDIMETLIYSRGLSDEERVEVENYLQRKWILKTSGRTLAPLMAVTSPPLVQMFMPGFSAHELPVSLNNINCLKYREDGKLVALGYDGNIWLLSDSDGDGLEDKTAPFWDKPTMRAPIGMALTPPHYPKGRGVFVASKGKLSLIVDTNRDDIADQEIIVADGWKEAWHGVDALGAAVAPDGSVYFGLGTANFTDGYLLGQDGKSHYDLKNERGTIMRVSPDFKTREIVCTGIRYPVAMAFNAEGDLFSTDQEGATWLPNGNPFDELLLIEHGKHYGFPPRHPRHLPNVVDEPSVFDYAPQHQCTCGLNFNEPVNGGPVFGPPWWRGDAFVTGYSRGKLFRTKLVKSAAGYVAQNQLIAAFNMLPVDACVSPQGDLTLSLHSGKPDWGSGPTGKGKLCKISYDPGVASQPVATWPVSPTETVIEFGRPLDAAQVKDWVRQISVTQGKYVSAGDQFETIRPGYQAVENQLLEPRYALKVLSAALTPDGRILIIRTEPRREAVNYAVSLPLPQQAAFESAYDLSGVQAEWVDAAGTELAAIWLPHLDLTVSRALTQPSVAHERFWSKAAKDKTLRIRGQLDLWQMLRAATQPDSQLDFAYPDELVTVVLKSEAPLEVNAPSMRSERVSDTEVHLTSTPKEKDWFPIEVALKPCREYAVIGGRMVYRGR